MGSLVLDSFEIRGFRGFETLRIETLGRVNLIVGKNNVGKTSLLEALRLYAKRGDPNVIYQLLEARDENRSARPSPDDDLSYERSMLGWRHLFYGRQPISEFVAPIKLGPVGLGRDSLSLLVDWTFQHPDQLALPIATPTPERAVLQGWAKRIPILNISMDDGQAAFAFELDTPPRYRRPLDLPWGSIPCVYSPAGGIGNRVEAALWDDVALTETEADVILALRLISGDVERVAVIGEPSSRERIPVVKVAGFADPVPLRSLGDGMNRLFGIILSLVSAKNGLLLVDEIENGLHYSVQADVWRLIINVARRLNVQVFATSHSWDCVESFQEAATEDAQSEGYLIRLHQDDNGTRSTVFSERRLRIATKEQIELR